MSRPILVNVLERALLIAAKAVVRIQIDYRGDEDAMSTALQELETLSVAERVQIVEDIWDSIARSNANLPVPQWQQDELTRRKERYLRNPDSGETWDQVKQSILGPR